MCTTAFLSQVNASNVEKPDFLDYTWAKVHTGPSYVHLNLEFPTWIYVFFNVCSWKILVRASSSMSHSETSCLGINLAERKWTSAAIVLLRHDISWYQDGFCGTRSSLGATAFCSLQSPPQFPSFVGWKKSPGWSEQTQRARRRDVCAWRCTRLVSEHQRSSVASRHEKALGGTKWVCCDQEWTGNIWFYSVIAAAVCRSHSLLK